jgi:cell surface protein SprA
MNQIFTNFAVSNGYTSTLSMNSFTTALNYGDPLGIGHPGFVDTVTGNFVPFYLVPNITISEQFSPLIDIDMQFVNLMQAKFGYSMSRQLSLSLANYQMSETRSTEFTMGLGWKKKGMPLPFHIKLPGKNGLPSNRLENDMTFRLDYSIRDDATTNSFLDQNYATPVGGQRVRDLAPSIEYVVNSRIQLKFYFDQRRIVPKISTSAPITTTRFGLQIRISLADVVAAQSKVGSGFGTGSSPSGPPSGLPAQQPPPGK